MPNNGPPPFGGGLTETQMHPVVVVALLLAIVLILTLPRRYVLATFLFVAFVIPYDQVVVYAAIHFPVRRILIMAACLRLLIERSKGGKLFPNGLNNIDKAFIIWASYHGLARILLFHVGGVVPGQIAFWIESFGGYFVLRYLIQDVEDIARGAKILALLALIAAACMSIEHFHGVNIFAYTGSRALTPEIRNATIRAQAYFGHPILAGCFGATLLPLFYWLWKSGRAKRFAAAGMLAAPVMVFFSASSTPVAACAGGIGALFLWPIRRSMRLVRWGIVFALLGLQIVMKAPVWFLIWRFNPTGSSDAFDRAALVDNFVRHFSDWWLIGTNDNATGKWGWGMWDLTNGFVAEGEVGGLVTFICFVALFAFSFGRLGKMRKQVEGDKEWEWLCWSLGAVLFAHLLALFGVAYFDQTQIWWCASLAMVSATTAGLQTAPASAERLAEVEITNSTWEEPARAGPAP